MNLTEQEKVFIDQRHRFARSWPVAGSVSLAIVFVLAGWLWLSRPFLINPWAVFSAIDSESIPETTVILMAAMLPIVMLTCFFILVVCLAFFFVAFSNERKHIAIIRRLTASQNGQKYDGSGK
jgi:hypothetical protein